MPRSSRIVLSDMPHHITQRGNSQQIIFLDDKDRSVYICLLQEYCGKFGLSILAYCLMNNHVHFIAVPSEPASIAKVFSIVHMRYSQYFNKKKCSSGHLWQGRFYSCILDEPHMLRASRYVERNPVRAGMVEIPWKWQWSSALEHTGKSAPRFEAMKMLELINMTPGQWERYIEYEEEEFIDILRQNTVTGRPLVTDKTMLKLEKDLGKTLVAPQMGRPKKSRVKK